MHATGCRVHGSGLEGGWQQGSGLQGGKLRAARQRVQGSERGAQRWGAGCGMQGFKEQGIFNTAWAFATTKVPSEGLFGDRAAHRGEGADGDLQGAGTLQHRLGLRSATLLFPPAAQLDCLVGPLQA